MTQATISHAELAQKFGITGTQLSGHMITATDKPKVKVSTKVLAQPSKMNARFRVPPRTLRTAYYEYESAMKFFERHKDWIAK